MQKLAKILCTTICALSSIPSFADDVGFIADQEMTLTSPLDSLEPLQVISPVDSHIVDVSAEDHHSSSSMISAAPAKKSAPKQVAVKPFTGKVKAKKLRMRARADVDSAIVTELKKGDFVAVVAEKGDFYVVEAPQNIKAFVFRSYVLDNVIEGHNVNVRLKPSVDSPVLTHLNSGDTVSGSICKTNNKWMEIALPSDVRFYVAKQFIENAGSPDVKARFDARRQSAHALLENAQHLGVVELSKNYPDIDFDKVRSAFETVMNDYVEFDDLISIASEDMAALQEQFIDKRLSYSDSKAGQDLDTLASSEEVNSQLLSIVTDKMKLWEPIEESLYLSWATINEGKSLDEYYTEQKLGSASVSGILEPYTAPVKCKPGDFIIRQNDMPVAYVYSTQLNLQGLVGHKATLKGAPRPNNNFAFPAYFILSAE